MYPSRSGCLPVVTTSTTREPDGDAHETVKTTSTTPPAGTVTACGLGTVRVHPVGSPRSSTVCSPGATSSNTTDPLALTLLVEAALPSTATVYTPPVEPLPVVIACTTTQPGCGGGPSRQSITNVTCVVRPSSTETVRRVAPCTVHRSTMPPSSTVWSRTARRSNVTVPFGPTVRVTRSSNEIV